jgi:hypothetical protein
MLLETPQYRLRTIHAKSMVVMGPLRQKSDASLDEERLVAALETAGLAALVAVVRDVVHRKHLPSPALSTAQTTYHQHAPTTLSVLWFLVG